MKSDILSAIVVIGSAVQVEHKKFKKQNFLDIIDMC